MAIPDADREKIILKLVKRIECLFQEELDPSEAEVAAAVLMSAFQCVLAAWREDQRTLVIDWYVDQMKAHESTEMMH